MATSLNSALTEQLQAAFPPARRALLDRIVLRAQAEAPYALSTIGTGAPITAKRAMAVKLALEDNSLSLIAEKTHLSEARIRSVLTNVLAHGLPALYPTFVEEVPLPEGMTSPSLWKIIRPILESSLSSHNVRASKWNPAFLLELLITQGTLQDFSNSHLEAIIRNHIDPEMAKNSARFEYTDSGHTPPVTGTSLWPNIFALASVILILLLGVAQNSHLMEFIGALFTFFFGFSLIKSLLEIRLLHRVIAHNKIHGPAPAASPTEPPHPSIHNPAPPLPITILHSAALPPIQWNFDALSEMTNALNEPPRSVLYLWVFAAQNDQGGFETQGWPQLGPVHLLLNATALTLGKLASDLDKLLVSDQPTLDATIAAYDNRVGTYSRPMLFVMGALGKYNYRGYPIHTLVCNDAVWKPAVHQLAARCDLAVVNLSGFNPNHPGLEYEILHLLSGGPPRQFVFLYERYTDADAVITSVLSLWDTLWSRLESPPAFTPELIFIRVPDSQRTGYAMQFDKAPHGLGWLAKTMVASEGEYTPIAGRIVNYLNSRQAEGTAP